MSWFRPRCLLPILTAARTTPFNLVLLVPGSKRFSHSLLIQRNVVTVVCAGLTPITSVASSCPPLPPSLSRPSNSADLPDSLRAASYSARDGVACAFISFKTWLKCQFLVEFFLDIPAASFTIRHLLAYHGLACVYSLSVSPSRNTSLLEAELALPCVLPSPCPKQCLAHGGPSETRLH